MLTPQRHLINWITNQMHLSLMALPLAGWACCQYLPSDFRLCTWAEEDEWTLLSQRQTRRQTEMEMEKQFARSTTIHTNQQYKTSNNQKTDIDMSGAPRFKVCEAPWIHDWWPNGWHGWGRRTPLGLFRTPWFWLANSLLYSPRLYKCLFAPVLDDHPLWDVYRWEKMEKMPWLPGGDCGLVASPLLPLARALQSNRFPKLAASSWYTEVLAAVRKLLCVSAEGSRLLLESPTFNCHNFEQNQVKTFRRTSNTWKNPRN